MRRNPPVVVAGVLDLLYLVCCLIPAYKARRTPTLAATALILRGLDALTTEETIVAALGKVTALTVKNMKVIRDEVTNTSRSFGFIEMNSIQDSTSLLETINRLQPFEVDGKAVLVSYAKNTFSTV